MITTAPRIHMGVALRPIPRAPVQPVFALEPEAFLPRGFSLREDAGGLHLMRGAEDMGPMVSHDVACRYAAALARMGAAQEAQG
jgi:hypothetical protein